jgi:hypothetical protein
LKDREKYLTGPDVIEWVSDVRFQVRGQKKMWGQAAVYDEKLDVFIKGFPPGTILSASDAQATVDGEGDAHIKASAAGLLGTLSTEKLMGAKVESAEMSLQVPGKPPFTVRLPPLVAPGIENVLKRVTAGPVLFAGETADQPAPLKSLMWLDWVYDHPIFGGAATLKDLDGLAIVKRLDGPTKNCTGYKGSKGEAAPDIKLRLSPAEATVYARRTGKVVATRVFPAVDECPSFATGEQGKILLRDSPLPQDDLKAWLRGQINPS